LNYQKKKLILHCNIANNNKNQTLWLTENGRAVDAPAIAEAEQKAKRLTL
jgi:hypothetical protein